MPSDLIRGWTSVRMKKTRQNKRIEPGSDTIRTGKAPGASPLSVTQQQVLDALAKVASPRGTALTNAGVLSAVTVNDGKVFFSINVDAAEARAWESVRAQAEPAVRAIPGVTAAMIALTAERKAGAAAAPPHRHSPGVAPVSAHKPPHSPASPMAKQSEIPGIAAVIAVA